MFNNAAFVTLTYARDTYSPREAWQRINNDFNRYIQRLRRGKRLRYIKLGDVEYLRAYESHKDGYPHVHALILTKQDIRDRSIYLKEEPRKSFKLAWPHGLTDAQSPKYKNNGAIGYILKYMSKSSSSGNLWKQILTENLTVPSPEVNALGYPLKPPPGENVWKSILIPDQTLLLKCTLKKKRIKLLMWSRHFISEYKKCLSS